MSRWRTLRLEWVRVIRQPWRLVMMLGGAVGAGWVYQQVFEESFGAWPLILLVSLVSGFLFGTALRSPPVSDTTPKARPGTEREST